MLFVQANAILVGGSLITNVTGISAVPWRTLLLTASAGFTNFFQIFIFSEFSRESVCQLHYLVDSAPRLGVYYFLSLTLSVCLYVCLSHCSFRLLLLFCSSIELSHFLAISSPCGTLQNCFFFDFWFRPRNPKNLHLHKITYNSACMSDRPEMFAPTRGFSWMADSKEPRTMLWGRPLLPWQRNLGKFGLFFDKIAYKSACMPGRPDMFEPTAPNLGAKSAS